MIYRVVYVRGVAMYHYIYLTFLLFRNTFLNCTVVARDSISCYALQVELYTKPAEQSLFKINLSGTYTSCSAVVTCTPDERSPLVRVHPSLKDHFKKKTFPFQGPVLFKNTFSQTFPFQGPVLFKTTFSQTFSFEGQPLFKST